MYGAPTPLVAASPSRPAESAQMFTSLKPASRPSFGLHARAPTSSLVSANSRLDPAPCSTHCSHLAPSRLIPSHFRPLSITPAHVAFSRLALPALIQSSPARSPSSGLVPLQPRSASSSLRSALAHAALSLLAGVHSQTQLPLQNLALPVGLADAAPAAKPSPPLQSGSPASSPTSDHVDVACLLSPSRSSSRSTSLRPDSRLLLASSRDHETLLSVTRITSVRLSTGLPSAAAQLRRSRCNRPLALDLARVTPPPSSLSRSRSDCLRSSTANLPTVEEVLHSQLPSFQRQLPF